MMNKLLVTLAQINVTVGAVAENATRMIGVLAQAHDSDLVIFPELALSGYPPEDLLFRDDLLAQVTTELMRIATAATSSACVVGHPWREQGKLYNCVSVLHQGQVLARYRKQRLPQYGVFDEQRYFTAGSESVYFDFRGQRIGLLICEDIWHPEPLAALQQQGVDWVAVVNASPFEQDKRAQRWQMLQQRVHECGLGIVYVNLVGGQDELVFDGRSLVMDAQGHCIAELPHAQEALAQLALAPTGWQLLSPAWPLPQSSLQEVYQALTLSLADYVRKNGFRGVTLGLSGGIDSALTLALAVDALGAAQVQAVMMPFHYTASMSIEDAEQQARTLGVDYHCLPIASIYDSFVAQLAPLLNADQPGITEQNIQARSRGVLLMALSNQSGKLLLTTGNKSELAVGYCTLYGDMCGGFAVLKDVPKTLVFALARWRNQQSPCIPERVIERPPSAELAPGQTDQDSLPAYDVLDAIMQRYLEQDASAAEIIAAGFSEADVQRVLQLIERNEYKRRQGAVGPKITARNFGRDRRYPITHQFRPWRDSRSTGED